MGRFGAVGMRGVFNSYNHADDWLAPSCISADLQLSVAYRAGDLFSLALVCLQDIQWHILARVDICNECCTF